MKNYKRFLKKWAAKLFAILIAIFMIATGFIYLFTNIING
jgi:hypothetical protein